MSTKPYPDYKDSGQDLIGAVPSKWNVTRLRSALNLKKRLVGDKSDEHLLLSLTMQGVIPRDMENRVGKLPADFTTYQAVVRDDLVFCLFDVEETPRTVGWVSEPGMVTGAYTAASVLKPFHPKYVAYYYLSLDQHKSLRGYYAGLRNTIRKTDFFNIPIPCPTLSEQSAIADYLDHETGEIDAFIADQEQLIAVLNERRAATIAQAVTKGLDPNADMKDSGFEWLGHVPSHWSVSPLWALFKRGKSLGTGSEELLSVYRDHGVVPTASRDDNINKPSEDRSKYQVVESGDLVINKMKAWQGSVAISPHNGIVSPAYFVFKPLASMNLRYVHHLMRSVTYFQFYASISKGVRPGQWDLDPDQHKLLPVLMPTLAEQAGIVTYLDGELAEIDAAIQDAKHSIELSKERRAALISAVVTGKIDVRTTQQKAA